MRRVSLGDQILTRPDRRVGGEEIKTYDCAFLEPEALPPDLPPPVILKGVVWGVCG